MRFFTPMEVHQPIAQFFLFKGEPENVPCLNTSCIRVPKRSFLAHVVFELYRVAGKCDRSPPVDATNQKKVNLNIDLNIYREVSIVFIDIISLKA